MGMNQRLQLEVSQKHGEGSFRVFIQAWAPVQCFKIFNTLHETHCFLAPWVAMSVILGPRRLMGHLIAMPIT